MTGLPSLVIDQGHPSIAGHFPGDPIVPGALLVDHIVCNVERTFGRRVVSIAAAKFLTPVRPQQSSDFSLETKDEGRIVVTASVAGVRVLSLTLTLGNDADGDRQLD